MLIITADHGCDPATPSTDHSREYTPMIAYGKQLKENVDLGVRDSFADIGSTVLEWFGLDSDGIFGTSFLKEIVK
jgi:phosphopentomutase